MEIFELRYFLAVAEEQNIHRASERLRVSPASLSKAVARLEDELGVSLFGREGRNIRLNASGKLLKVRAAEILRAEESARVELAGELGSLNVAMAGPEALIARYGLPILATLRKRYPQARFDLQSCEEDEALEKVENGEAHLAWTTAEPGNGITAKIVGESKFVTVVGEGHPLYDAAKGSKRVPVEEVLKHSFVSSRRPILGTVGKHQSSDGWRDDRFPRRVDFVASSLRVLADLCENGTAVAYVPDYLAERMGVEILRITGCPYECVQKIRMVSRRPKDTGWLNALF